MQNIQFIQFPTSSRFSKTGVILSVVCENSREKVRAMSSPSPSTIIGPILNTMDEILNAIRAYVPGLSESESTSTSNTSSVIVNAVNDNSEPQPHQHQVQ